MNQPPGSSNDRRHLPRHIRDGEHEMWHDAGDAGAGTPSGTRLWRLLVYLVVAAAVIAGLWLYNGTRG